MKIVRTENGRDEETGEGGIVRCGLRTMRSRGRERKKNGELTK